ncbi:MAG: multiheme c-type cytochrome [Deferrisomatales bacterium]|nr:multiheme c-type cytochrome [Deferrisomatales bacterium]
MDGGNLFFSKSQLHASEQERLLRKARVLVDGYNAMGVDAVALGPLDFAAGFTALGELQRQAQFPLLCANIVHRDSGVPVFQPTAVVRRGVLRVGLIGVVDSALGARGLGPGGEDYRVEPLFSTISHYADELAGQCDLVVVLSAVPMKKFRLLAKKLPTVDFYVAGDPQDKLRIPWTIGDAMIASTTQLGRYLGSAHIVVDGGGKWVTHQFVPMKPECRDAPAVKRLVDGYYRDAAVSRLQTPGGPAPDDEERVNLVYGGAVYVGAAECGRCHGDAYLAWQRLPHARAWQDLPEANRNRLECLECHVTGLGRWGGYGHPGAAEEGPNLVGVQCEVCHGPGSLHPAVELASASRAQVVKRCRTCHTPARSPKFRLQEYLSRIACTQGEHAAATLPAGAGSVSKQ